jgi:hypothetical protein
MIVEFRAITNIHFIRESPRYLRLREADGERRGQRSELARVSPEANEPKQSFGSIAQRNVFLPTAQEWAEVPHTHFPMRSK